MRWVCECAREIVRWMFVRLREREREMKNYICQGWKNKQEIERRQIQWSVMFVATTMIINILSFGLFLSPTLKSVFVVRSGVIFTNILQADFTCSNPTRAKLYLQLDWIFTLLGSGHTNVASKTLLVKRW